MRLHISNVIRLAALGLTLAGCKTQAPAATQVLADTPTSQPATQTAQVTVLVLTPLSQTTPQVTPAPYYSPVPVIMATLQDTPYPLFTSTQQPAAPTEQVTASATPQPSPTPLALRTARIEGDPAQIDGTIFWPDTGGPAALGVDFWVEAHNPKIGVSDGAGVASVGFEISDSSGQTVYSYTADKPSYCAFGGGDPDCSIFIFADNNNQWPGTNLPVQNDDYTLNATVNTADGNQWSGIVTFTIHLP